MTPDRIDSDTRVSSPSGFTSFTGGQSASSQGAQRAELDTTEVLAILKSAIALDDADPQRTIQALASARASSASTYEALLQMSDADLTVDMRQVIRVYQAAGDQMAQLQMRYVDEALGNYTSLFDEIMKIPAFNRTDQMMRFLEIFLRIAQQSRQTATTLSVLGFQTQIAELRSQADKIKDEGNKAYDAGITRGAMSMASGAMVGGLGAGSAYKQVRGSRHAEDAANFSAQKIEKQQEIADTRERISTLERQAPFEPNALELNVRRGELHTKSGELAAIQNNLNAETQVSTQYSQSANNWMTAGRATEPVVGAVGGMAGSSLEQQANVDRSEQTERQAAATAGEQNKNLAEKFAESSQAVVASVLQTVRDVGQAEAEALKAAARA
jgi:hypothetical protein